MTDAHSSLKDVCFEVCTALSRAGIKAVLSGGSAATIYAPEAYLSIDADFIITVGGEDGGDILSSLGYAQEGGTYVHQDNRYTVEFPKGPLAIDDELITAWETLQSGDRLLYILSRTDCVRDRLLWFYFYNDRPALAAAVGVARSGLIDEALIREWSRRLGYAKACEQFFADAASK